MPKKLLHVKNTERLTNKEKRNRWISIESELQDVEQNRTIYFLFGGGDLKLNYVCILDNSSYRILIGRGEIMREANSKINYRLMIDNIISDLKSEKIRSHKRYNAKEFYEKYLKEFSSKESLQEASTIKSTTTELPNLNQIMGKVKRSNASNGITIQNIENVKNMTNILGDPILRDTSVRRPKLLETPRSNKENMGVLTVGMLAVLIALVAAMAAAATFKCRFCNRKSRSRNRSEEEIPSSNLLNLRTLESRDNYID